MEQSPKAGRKNGGGGLCFVDLQLESILHSLFKKSLNSFHFRNDCLKSDAISFSEKSNSNSRQFFWHSP